MAGERTLSKLLDALGDGVRWLCDRSPSPVAHLDEETQRRLVLRWARDRSQETLEQVRKQCPTPAELEKTLREGILCSVVFCWWLAILWLPQEVGKAYDFRRKLASHWEAWLAEPDPDCEQWALEGEIRRRLRGMPRNLRKSSAAARAELDRISRTYRDLCKKRDQLDGALAAAEPGPADRHAELSARLELESDPLTRTSLERRLRTVEGQDTLHRDLQSWKARIAAAQSECTEGLRHLRTQLALLSATDVRSVSAGEQALASLHELNGQLSATVAATDEVLQLGRAS